VAAQCLPRELPPQESGRAHLWKHMGVQSVRSAQGSALTWPDKVQGRVMARLISHRLQVLPCQSLNFRYVAALSIDSGLTANDSVIGARMQAKNAFYYQLAHITNASQRRWGATSCLRTLQPGRQTANHWSSETSCGKGKGVCL
jgi:hypothetical protein